MAELEAKCLSYSLALRRAEQQQASDKSMIASLSQSCAKLRAEVHHNGCMGTTCGITLFERLGFLNIQQEYGNPSERAWK